MKIENDDDLSRQLAAQAPANSPEFSEMLHQRIMRHVKSAPSHASTPRIPWRALAAVAAILIIVISFWKLRPSEKPPIIASQNPIPSLPKFSDPLPNLPRDFNEAKYGYLDRDAQKLTEFVIDQLDFLPQGQPQKPQQRG